MKTLMHIMAHRFELDTVIQYTNLIGNDIPSGRHWIPEYVYGDNDLLQAIEDLEQVYINMADPFYDLKLEAAAQDAEMKLAQEGLLA